MRKETMINVAYYNDFIRCYSDGRIERLIKGKYWREVKQTCFRCNGYLGITINKKSNYWHRVIWEAFNGEIPKGLTINHKDEVKTNNSLDNLELMTIGDNKRYSSSKPVIGINIKTGEKIEFSSTMEAGRNGFYQSAVCNCVNGKLKSHHGYKWYFKADYESGK